MPNPCVLEGETARERSLRVDPTHAFPETWQELQPRLLRLLRARGCHVGAAEDIAQETGLRLYGSWGDVRHDSVWSLAATIALNLMRDGHRAATRLDLVEELPENAALSDTESTAMARLELARVAKAMAGMNPRYRSALLSLAAEEDQGQSRMVRSRARRQLRERLARVSGGILVFKDTLRRRAPNLPQWDPTPLMSTAGNLLAAVVVVGAVGMSASPTPPRPMNAATRGDSDLEVRMPRQREDGRVRSVSTRSKTALSERGRTVNRPPHDSEETWTPVAVDDTAVTMSQPRGGAGTDGSRTEAEVEAEAAGQEVDESKEVEHPPPDCRFYVDAAGNAAYHCEREEEGP